MSVAHLDDYVTSHGVDTEGMCVHKPATLEDHQIRTNYVSSTHGAGACNIEPAEGSTVEGLVMEISPAIRQALRIKEGWPDRYQEAEVEVLVGDAHEPLRAITYVVAPDHQFVVDMPVTRRYRRLVLDGARAAGLSQSYQEQLARLLRTTPSSLILSGEILL